MMKFRSKAIGGLALAVAGITALAACSSSSTSSGGNTTNGNTTVPGAIGSVPAAGTPSGKAGTITYALQPGASPNAIFPLPNSANNTVSNAFRSSGRCGGRCTGR